MKRSEAEPASGAIRIGELARASGLTPDTLRYYERLGLLAPAHRTSGNFRTYESATLDRLRFIRIAQDTRPGTARDRRAAGLAGPRRS